MEELTLFVSEEEREEFEAILNADLNDFDEVETESGKTVSLYQDDCRYIATLTGGDNERITIRLCSGNTNYYLKYDYTGKEDEEEYDNLIDFNLDESIQVRDGLSFKIRELSLKKLRMCRERIDELINENYVDMCLHTENIIPKVLEEYDKDYVKLILLNTIDFYCGPQRTCIDFRFSRYNREWANSKIRTIALSPQAYSLVKGTFRYEYILHSHQGLSDLVVSAYRKADIIDNLS